MKVVKAPAKINLALHVTGQRDSGYHTIDSLVVFADHMDASDTLVFSDAPDDGFSVSGAFADALNETNQADNLIIKARNLVRDIAHKTRVSAEPIHISLEKRLPVSAGLGGGSADAAAAILALHRFWGVQFNSAYSGASILAKKLGADVPMCVLGKPLRATGIGDQILSLNFVPALHMVLVNCGEAVATPSVFDALKKKENPPIYNLPEQGDDFATYLSANTRNDLQDAAISQCEQIQTQIDALNEQGAALARMSGSGATCFGIFESRQAAHEAAQAILEQQPDWWVVATRTSASAQPKM